ncbi:MAG: hypothetical protein IT307_09960, partial [Chloroflexi bacterium]|nr:hypothetical protein [Chloroflexota bacterium]
LHARLPRGSRLVNLAVSGSTAAQAIEQQLPVAQAVHPDLVTVWLAANDFNAGVPLEAYARDLERVIRETCVTGAVVLVGNLPDLSALAVAQRPGLDRAAIPAAIGQWNARIASIAAQNGAYLVDINGAWTAQGDSRRLLAADGLHPSTAGHRALADLFFSVYHGVAPLARPPAARQPVG